MNAVVIDKEAQRKSRIKLLGVLFIFAGPLMLAFVWLQMVKNDVSIASSSNGELITPATPLSEFSLSDDSGNVFSLEEVKGIWSMLYFQQGQCADTCEKNLYHMRQVRLALNQNMDRVQRIVVVGQNDLLSEELLAEHAGLNVISGDSESIMGLKSQFENAQSGMPERSNAIYLIDPYGNLMMRFPADLNPKAMLKDISTCLRFHGSGRGCGIHIWCFIVKI